MVDFIKSLNAGLASAKTAEQNRAEIDAVFGELNQQLSVATNNKVEIRRTDAPSYFAFTIQLAKTLQQEIKTVISVCSAYKNVQPTEIANWTQDRMGYPVRIEMAGNVMHVQDKQALERALSRILQDPLVGETIHKYMLLDPSGDQTP